jgi:hypothetical protein
MCDITHRFWQTQNRKLRKQHSAGKGQHFASNNAEQQQILNLAEWQRFEDAGCRQFY